MTPPDDGLWYPMPAMKRAKAAVRLQWNGRVFRATKFFSPTTGKHEWAEYVDGEIRWLPPDGKNWGEPSAWQPDTGRPWPDPLPDPLRGPAPRMWSSTLKFALVEDATAADLAREMEDDRESARANKGNVERSDLDKVQWWRDASQITYQAPGEITARMMEGRLMRAVAHAGTESGLTLKSRTVGTLLAELATAADQAFNQEDPRSSFAVKFQPLAQDHKDFPEAMRWFTELNPPHLWHRKREPWSLNRMQRVIAFRAFSIPWSYEEIGQDIGRTGERARQIHKEALARVLKIANTKAAVSVEIEKLRERNRAHKRAS